ncbi:hypothetical protein Pmani_029239 [Petrolisthes manimaculis]|uniref:Uncharacterized protein n=1 Tax=Petrolisthes manimaculis TaxID=1843537 RepID=A0AAE1TX71_9EUCA|nr:hypothetical protein Pmani_029239 [Petrolisthes manimaculis]
MEGKGRTGKKERVQQVHKNERIRYGPSEQSKRQSETGTERVWSRLGQEKVIQVQIGYVRYGHGRTAKDSKKQSSTHSDLSFSSHHHLTGNTHSYHGAVPTLISPSPVITTSPAIPTHTIQTAKFIKPASLRD